ncbi:unnamed protein product [Trichogramma brassicae]|uniref:Uncharacterized protein n=1 Tax=Trichogramma brassicae TaxID=86971 RepID=A0A6H5IUL0_9HYME|nr:unnamed protein product [Trichogramma brassicae]
MKRGAVTPRPMSSSLRAYIRDLQEEKSLRNVRALAALTNGARRALLGLFIMVTTVTHSYRSEPLTMKKNSQQSSHIHIRLVHGSSNNAQSTIATTASTTTGRGEIDGRAKH